MSLGLGAALFYFAFRHVEWSQISSALRRAQPLWLLPAGFIFLTGLWLRGLRIAYLGEGRASVPKPYASGAVLCLAVNNFIPLRVGELLKIYYLAKRAGLGFLKSSMVIVAERVLDVISLLLLMGLAFIGNSSLFLVWLEKLSGPGTDSSQGLPWPLIAVCCLLVAAMAVLAFDIGGLRRRLWLLASALLGQLREIARALAKRLPAAMAAALLIWLADLFFVWSMAEGFQIHLSFFQLLFLQVTLSLAYASSVSPGALGLYELMGSWVLESLGFATDQALAYLLAAHGFTYVLLFAASFLVIARENSLVELWRGLFGNSQKATIKS